MALDQVTRISQLTDRLYLSSFYGLFENQDFVRASVDVLLCAASELVPALESFRRVFPNQEIAYVPLEDAVEQELSLGQYVAYLGELVNCQKRRVLVFCKMGISRSATLCLGYFIRYYGMTLAQSNGYVKRKRSIIYPNSGFLRQLAHYETTTIAEASRASRASEAGAVASTIINSNRSSHYKQ